MHLRHITALLMFALAGAAGCAASRADRVLDKADGKADPDRS